MNQPPPTCPVCAGAVSVDRFGVAACRTDSTHQLQPWTGEVRRLHGTHPARWFGVAVTAVGRTLYSQPCLHEHITQARAKTCADRLARAKNRSAGLLQGRQSGRL